jgi:hypothetical protein
VVEETDSKLSLVVSTPAFFWKVFTLNLARGMVVLTEDCSYFPQCLKNNAEADFKIGQEWFVSHCSYLTIQYQNIIFHLVQNMQLRFTKVDAMSH